MGDCGLPIRETADYPSARRRQPSGSEVTDRKPPESNPPRARPRLFICFEDEDENEDEMGEVAYPAKHFASLPAGQALR